MIKLAPNKNNNNVNLFNKSKIAKRNKSIFNKSGLHMLSKLEGKNDTFLNKRLNSLNHFFIAKSLIQKSNYLRKSASVSNLDDACGVLTEASSSNTTKHIHSSMKAMKTLLILLLGFYVCWLPLIVYFLTFATQQYNNLVIYILMFVACCNAVIDPLVYAFYNREFNKF